MDDVLVLYRRRWFLLLVVSLLQLSNALSFVSFGPIGEFAVSFYRSENAPLLFNTSYLLCSPIGFLSIFLINKPFGIKWSCLLSSWLNFFGNIVKTFAASTSFFGPENNSFRLWLTVLGHCFSGCANPFVMYLPTKVAAFWFPDSQRVVVNSCATISGVLGTALIFAFAPRIVNPLHPNDFFLLLGIVTIPSAIVSLLSIFITSLPPTPPSVSAAARFRIGQQSIAEEEQSSRAERNDTNERIQHQPEGLVHRCSPTGHPDTETEHHLHSNTDGHSNQGFWHQIMWALRNKQFMILNIMMGNGFGITNTFNTNIQQILCSRGHDIGLAGTIGVVNTISGFIFSPLISLYVDRTKRFEETLKVLVSTTGLTSIGMMVLFGVNSTGLTKWLILLAAALTGIATAAIFPIGLEAGVETTFPLPEATSTGLLIQVGQVLGMVFVSFCTFLRRPPTEDIIQIQSCTAKATRSLGVFDWNLSLMAWATLSVLNAIVFVIIFKPIYRRINFERRRVELPSNREVNDEFNPFEPDAIHNLDNQF